MIWVREGRYDDPRGVWHLSDAEGGPATGLTRCAVQIDSAWSANWTRGEGMGAEWIRLSQARLCLECLDSLRPLTVTWNAKGIFTVE